MSLKNLTVSHLILFIVADKLNCLLILLLKDEGVFLGAISYTHFLEENFLSNLHSKFQIDIFLGSSLSGRNVP